MKWKTNSLILDFNEGHAWGEGQSGHRETHEAKVLFCWERCACWVVVRECPLSAFQSRVHFQLLGRLSWRKGGHRIGVGLCRSYILMMTRSYFRGTALREPGFRVGRTLWNFRVVIWKVASRPPEIGQTLESVREGLIVMYLRRTVHFVPV